MTSRLDAAMVREAARGRWPTILQALNIVVPNGPKKHGPCPVCTGADRFRFDDRDGHGSFFCNQCVPKAGDGFALTMRCLKLSFPEMLTTVAGVLGLAPDQRTERRQPLPPPPLRIDRVATAFKFELGAMDLRMRASKIQEAARRLDITTLTDDELDRAIDLVSRAYTDIARAEDYEAVADNLRLRDFVERKHLDASRPRGT